MARTPRRFGVDPRDEGTTGGPRTTPMPPERKEVLRKAEEENARNRRNKPPVEKKAKGGSVSNFGKAFRAAREAGKKEFTFGGKSYNTKIKEDAPAKKDAAPAKDKPTSSFGVLKRDANAAPAKDKPAKDKPAKDKPAATKTKKAGAEQMFENLGPIGRAAKEFGRQFKGDVDLVKGQAQGDIDLVKRAVKAMTPSEQAQKNIGLKKGGKTMMYAKGGKAMKMAKGGSTASKRADGIAVKGKTKAMAMGGMTGRPAMTGLDRAAAMSGRAMPMTGRPGMKKGGKTKGC